MSLNTIVLVDTSSPWRFHLNNKNAMRPAKIANPISESRVG